MLSDERILEIIRSSVDTVRASIGLKPISDDVWDFGFYTSDYLKLSKLIARAIEGECRLPEIDPYTEGCLAALCKYAERDEVPPAIRGDIFAIREYLKASKGE